MLWFLLSSTLLMALVLLMPGGGGLWRRRTLEITALLVVLLPLLRLALEQMGLHQMSLGHSLTQDDLRQQSQVWMLAWGIGAIGGLLFLIWRLFSLQCLRKHSQPLPQRLAHQIAAELDLTVPIVDKLFRLCREIETPMVVPGLSAMVLLPATWMQWSPRLQRSALRHEWHHILNRDAWFYVAMRIFCTALWFHPLAWYLAGTWTDECEHLADHAAVGGQDPTDYAADLLGLATRVPTPIATWHEVPGFLGLRDPRLHRRVRALLAAHERTKPSLTWLSGGGLLLLLVTAGSCAWSGIRPPEATKQVLLQEAHLRLGADAFPADF